MVALSDADDGRQLVLTITGYELAEFDRDDDWHDRNWLDLRATLKRPGEPERSGGPDACLLTAEAAELVQWLRAVAEGAVPNEIEFLEPELSLGAAAESGQLQLQVTLRFGLSAAFGADPLSLDPVSSTFRTSPEALRDAADQLEAELRHFPVRGEEP